jgi:hypothetical protein
MQRPGQQRERKRRQQDARHSGQSIGAERRNTRANARRAALGQPAEDHRQDDRQREAGVEQDCHR